MLRPTPTICAKVPSFGIERRQLLTGLAILAGAAPLCAREPLTRRGTPQLTTGPFFPLSRPPDQDWDMTHVAGKAGVAQGVIMELAVEFPARVENHCPVPGSISGRPTVWAVTTIPVTRLACHWIRIFKARE